MAQDFLKQLRQNRDDLEAAMKAERQPLDEAVAAIRVKYRDPLELVGIAITRCARSSPRGSSASRIDSTPRPRNAPDWPREAADQADAARETAQQTGTVESELEAQRKQRAARGRAARCRQACRPSPRAR